MSYEKNTINRSKIDNTIEILKNLKIPYKLTVLGSVIGLGVNDITFEEDIKNMLHKANGCYNIRRLEYKDVVVLEKMIRNVESDMDDYIVSFEFKIGNESKEWELEETYG